MKGKANSKQNNAVNLIKFLAAMLVILAHAHSLSDGSKDLLARFIKGTGFGSLAVAIFFAFSGYFIMKSIQSKGDKGFLIKRVKRIFPELIIVVLLTIFVVGPIFTNLSLKNYFLNPITYLYSLNALLIPYHNLPGVFTANTYKNVVNGALWTLPVEFVCYIMIYVLYKMKLVQKRNRLIIVFALGLGVYLSLYLLNIKFIIDIVRPVLVFLFSAVLFFIEDIKKEDLLIIGLISILFIVSRNIVLYHLFLIILLPLILFYIIKHINFRNRVVAILGRASYCIYLVGFVVQQSIVATFGGHMNPYVNYGLAVVIATLLGILINTIYEKKLKRIVDKI
ncbi:MAG: acyltransferase [Bacilli bacterium]|nr:acyltransferase [Bacilli bacterium]